MPPLRFGLLGTGYWALHAHGTALTSSPHAVLQGVWAHDPAKAADLGARLGAKGYPNLDDLLGEVDAVSIAVAPEAQPGLAVRAARAGCHLLLEKPLALEVAGAKAVVDAVADNGVASIVFFTQRFRGEIERWTQAAAAAGPWRSAHLVHYSNIFQPGSPYAGSAWRRQHGALWDLGPHGLAAVLPLLGPVASVTARRGEDGTGTAHLILQHQGGADSTLSLSLDMPPPATGSHLTLYGERGTRTRPESPFEVAGVFRAAIEELAGLVEAGGRAHRCDVRFGSEVVQILAAAAAAQDQAAVTPGR